MRPALVEREDAGEFKIQNSKFRIGSMRIGLVRRGYSATGGAEAYLLRLAAALGGAGHEPIIFSDCKWPEAALKQPGVELGQIAWDVRGAMEFANVFPQLSPKYDCGFILSLERIWACDAFRAGDGVHSAWLDRRAKYEPRWKTFLRRWNPKHRQILRLERTLFSGGAGCVIANSKMVKREIETHFPYPADRIHVIYNGVPSPAAPTDSRAEIRRELALADDEYVLLFAGSGWERKGLRFAIDALNRARLPHATLFVAGRGKSRAMAGSERVRFLGPRSDIPRLLAAADAFILPTIYDPFSNACLEALAAGLPVITTRANGFAEIIEPGIHGEVIDQPHDIDALASAITRWDSPEKRAAIRPQLLALGAQFSIEENLRQTLALLPK